MAIKLLVLLCLLQVLTTNSKENKYPSLRDIAIPADLDFCNETACTPPCPSAPPPKRCPTGIPICHFGCACHTDCDVGIVYCFQTKDCLETRRFFTKSRRVTKI